MNKKTACQEEADRILAYMKENYSGEITLNSRKFVHATREISDNDKIRTCIFLSVFTGEEFNLIGAYMKAYIKGYAENEGCEITKYVSSLEELKKTGSKSKGFRTLHFKLRIMEVKIKNGNGMVDATIEMVDGAMVVSPKDEKVEPKDGDVFCVDLLHPCVGIVKEVYSYGKPDKDRLYFSVGYWKQSGNIQLGTFCACNRNIQPNYRPATEEERQKLFDKLKEEGWEWDAEKKELVKLKWKLKIGETYYRPDFQHCEFICYSGTTDYNKIIYIKDHINKGWVFRTKEECQAFCDRLNESVNSVKP